MLSLYDRSTPNVFLCLKPLEKKEEYKRVGRVDGIKADSEVVSCVRPGALAVPHFQSQNLKAFILFRYPQPRRETLPAHMPLDSDLKTRPIQVEKLITRPL